MKNKIAVVLTAGMMAGLSSVSAALVESLSNVVSDGTIIIGSDRSGWDGLTPYVADPNEGLLEDWHQVTIANDDYNFYVRYEMNSSDGWSGLLHMYIDIDLNRGTGFIGGESQFSVGAEFMLEGGSLWAFTGGSQTTWGWEWVSYVGDGSVADDYVASFSRADVTVNTFNFVLDAEQAGGGTHDYYVDSSNQGAGGGWLQYTTVPEPGVSVLFGLGLGTMLLRRRHRSA